MVLGRGLRRAGVWAEGRLAVVGWGEWAGAGMGRGLGPGPAGLGWPGGWDGDRIAVIGCGRSRGVCSHTGERSSNVNEIVT